MIIIYILLGIAIGGVTALAISRGTTKRPETDTSAQLVLQQLNELQRTIDTKLGESQKSITESMRYQSSQSAQIIGSITEQLTRLDEGNKQVLGFAEGLAQLQDILKNPKQRGVLGEYYLETLLKNTLPPDSFEMQYRLGKDDSGAELIPDAVVFVKDKIIPIDSKFSLENYNRLVEATDPILRQRFEKQFVNDLKERITETSKYIQPEKNTMEFAFMFIPHEAIYYDLLVNKVGALADENENLIYRAASKYRVIIVSPTSFLAYLQTVLQGLNAMKMEKDLLSVIKNVAELGRHLKSHEEYHNKIGTTLKTVVNHYNTASKELKKVDKDVMRITGSNNDVDPVLIEDVSIETTTD